MIKKVKIALFTFAAIATILIFLILQSPGFQSYVVGRIIKPIEKTAEINIDFSNSEFDLFDGFYLKNLHVVSNEGIDLLSIGEFKISPRRTLLSLIHNDFHFGDIYLDNVSINYEHKTGEEFSNWTSLLNSFKSEEKSDSQSPDYSLEELKIYQCKIDINDEIEEFKAHFEMAGLELELNTFDIVNQIYDIEKLILLAPDIDIVRCKVGVSTKDDSESAEPQKDSLNIGNVPRIRMKDFGILNANLVFTTLDNELSDAIIEFNEVDILVRDAVFNGLDDFSFIPMDISLKNSNGLILNHLGANNVKIIDGVVNIDNLNLRTKDGLIKLDGDIKNVQGKTDFTNLDDLQIDLQIENSFINMRELGLLLPQITKSSWYNNFIDENVYVNSHVFGNMKDFHAENSHITVPGLMAYNGDVDIHGLQNPKRALINMRVESSRIDLRVVQKKFSNWKIPEEIQRMGVLEIEGFFDGFSNSFVTTANVRTDLGNVDLDLQFDISNEEQYSGIVSFQSFDLGKLLANNDFGKISLTADILEGKGLNIEDVIASFSATIDTFQFRNYTYSNANFTGRMSNKLVDGKFRIDDTFLDLSFDGEIDFSGDVPTGKFFVDIERADLCSTNLTQFPCELSMTADIDMFGKDLNSIQGSVELDSIFMSKDDRELFIEYADVYSTSVNQGMLFELKSNEIDAKIRGIFELQNVHKVLLNLMVGDYPDIAKRLNIKAPLGLKGNEDFDFAIEAKDLSDILSFVESKDLLSLDGELRGRWSSTKGLTSNSFNFRNINLKGIGLKNVLFNLDSQEGDGSFQLLIDRLNQGDRIIEGFELTAIIKESEIFFKVKNHEAQNNKIDFSGRGSPWGDGFKFIFESNILNIDSINWHLDEEATIAFQNSEVAIDNFVLQGEDRLIILDDIDKKGVSLSLKGFDFSIINPIVDYDKMYFEGTAYVDIRVENIFDKRKMTLDLEVPDFTINNDPYGVISVYAKENNGEMIDLSIKIEKDSQSLDALAYYDIKEQLINADISIVDYPMSIFEYIIDDGISRTTGTTDINARIYGEPSDMKIQGQGIIKNGGTRIDYLGEFYKMEDQLVKIDESKVYLTGVELEDHLGNVAVIEGHLNHNFLGDFTADLSISSEEFVGLNTTQKDNELYFGTGLGDITVSFLGPFDAIDIKVDAVTGKGSSLNIPLESTEYSLDKGFVNFDYRSEEDSTSRIEDALEAIHLSGADFEMNLSFTPEANVYVIFDESVNEVLFAKGSGDLRVIVKRDGTFEVFGNYLVESGDYLYSAYGITAKRFILRRGGVVRWTGDPYNAILDVEADYSGMRAPLDIFLSEFLISASENVRSEAKNRTDVALKLLLGGTLFVPDVNFDISFPNVVGELKTYTDNKMRSLGTTENGINNQVFGLMFFNNFLPSDNPLASLSGSTLGQTGNNTITEFFSSQLSVLVSDYFSDLIKDGTFINDIDFDIALSQNISFLEGQDQGVIGGFVDIVPDQVGLNVRPTFENDNWALNLGGDYIRESEFNNVNYLTGDFALDWFITNDKKLKLRFYGDFDYDEAINSRKQKYGFGINYRREFGKMSELSDALDKIAEGVRSKSGSW